MLPSRIRVLAIVSFVSALFVLSSLSGVATAGRQSNMAPEAGGTVGYYLVQFVSRIQPEWRNSMNSSEVVILGYVPNDTYVVRTTASGAENLRALPFVSGVVLYPPGLKMSGELIGATGTVTIIVTVFQDNPNPVQEAANQIAELGATVENITPENFALRVTAGGSLLPAIANISQVQWMQQWGPPQTDMNHIRVYTGADYVHNKGYSGANVVGEVMDSGIDPDHPEFQDRLLAIDGYSPEDPINDGHGTPAFGVVFARGADPNAEGMDSSMHPGPPSPTGVFRWFYGMSRTQAALDLVNNWGGVFQSHSWGLSGPQDRTYNFLSTENDQIVFDLDITMAQSMGNLGASGSARREAMAKDIISVGGIIHYDNEDRGDDKWYDPSYSQGGVGPATDGRVKPDLTGPADWVYAPWPGGGYTPVFRGTSSATPVVAGAAGLVYDMYRHNAFGNNPTGATPHAATVKALLIADAYQYDLSSQATRCEQGWGTPDLRQMYDNRYQHFIVDEGVPLEQDEGIGYQVQVTGGKPLKVSLVWTDPPGVQGASRHLVNDLDLTVVDPLGNTYRGNYGLVSNSLTPGCPGGSLWSSVGGSYDQINNVENVFIQSPMSGAWQIRVHARYVPIDGDPDTPGVYDQNFALVAVGPLTEHPLTVEDGADRIAFEPVRMTIQTSDALQMRFSNEGTEGTWSDWEPYSPTKYPWLLDSGKGTKTVFAQVKGADGQPRNLQPANTYVQYWDDRVDLSQYNRGTYSALPASGINPRIAVDPSSPDHLYAVWQQSMISLSNVNAIELLRSVTNGASWGSPIPVCPLCVDSRYPDVAVWAGFVHVVWQEQVSPGNWDVYYARFTLNGNPAGPVAAVATGLSNQEFPRIAAGLSGGPQSAVHVVYQDGATGDVMYVRSLDGVPPWSNPVPVSVLQAEVSTHPAIAADGQYVHVVFESGLSPNGKVFYRRADNWGLGPWAQDWLLSVTLSDQRHPDVAAVGPCVHVVWDQVEGAGKRIWYGRNTQFGISLGWELMPQTLSSPLSGVATSDAMSPSIDALGTVVSAAWQGDAEGHWEIHFARHFGNGDVALSPWEHWSRVTFAGYHARDAEAASLALGQGLIPQVNLVWSDENWGGWDIAYKNDVTLRGEPPFYDSAHGLLVDAILSDAGLGDIVAKTYQESLQMDFGTWAPVNPGGSVWNAHVLTEALGPGGTGKLRAVYRFTVPHAQGHESAPPTRTYPLTLCADTDSLTDIFHVTYSLTGTDPWWATTITIDNNFVCGTDTTTLTEARIGHHGYLWLKIEDQDTGPGDLIHSVTIYSPKFEDIDGAIWLARALPAGSTETDLRFTWIPSQDDPAITPGGHVSRYDIYMSSTYHDSFFVRVGSVASGHLSPSFVLRGGAVAGSPEAVIEGPAAHRFPRDAYFTVVARDDDGRTAPDTLRRVGRFAIDLPAEQVLLSIPLITPSTATLDVFAPIDGHWYGAWWYDASTGLWESYDVSRPPGQNTLLNVDASMSVQIGLTRDANGWLNTGVFAMVGVVPSTTQIQLYPTNWNMVGFPYLTLEYHPPFGPKAVSEALQGIPWTWVVTYDPTAPPGYTREIYGNDLILPGLGYWVMVSTSATWTLTNEFPVEALI